MPVSGEPASLCRSDAGKVEIAGYWVCRISRKVTANSLQPASYRSRDYGKGLWQGTVAMDYGEGLRRVAAQLRGYQRSPGTIEGMDLGGRALGVDHGVAGVGPAKQGMLQITDIAVAQLTELLCHAC